jgi:nitric oxide reductase subunit B
MHAARSFWDTILLWQWMRFPGDIVFALGAMLMAWDFLVKLWLLLPGFVVRLVLGLRMLPHSSGGRS